MSRVGYIYDPIYLEHDVPGHPESANRLRAIVTHLERNEVLPQMRRLEPRDATVDDLILVHDGALIDRVKMVAGMRGHHWLDVDTYVVERSYEAALRSCGGVLAATDAVLAGDVDSAFCLVRPPGHHATPVTAMGFCLFNNIAVAAAHSLERRGLSRIAIVDIDVHHGNGTQDAFYSEPRVLYFSTHQYPFYPGTGDWNETGRAPAEGNTINVPLPRGCGDTAYRLAYAELCAPALRRFQPDLILVSAGFDAHFADPLAQMLVSTEGYYDIATTLEGLANELCDGRIVYVLEGGYDLTAISWSAQACIDTLLDNEFCPDPLGAGPEVRGPEVTALIERLREVHDL